MHSRLFLFHKSHIYITAIIIEPHSELIWAPIVIILPCIPYHWSIPVATIGTYRRLGSRSRLTIASILHYLWSPLLILLRAYILLSIVIRYCKPISSSHYPAFYCSECLSIHHSQINRVLPSLHGDHNLHSPSLVIMNTNIPPLMFYTYINIHWLCPSHNIKGSRDDNYKRILSLD